MTSLVFNLALNAWAKGNIDFDTDTFKVMLVTSSYSPNKDTHDFRDDVTNEVVGTGYSAGGAAVTVTVGAVDTANDREEITLGGASWPTSTITAAAAVYYKSRGGLSSADEIIAYIDFGGNVVSSGGTFTLNSSTLRLQN